MNISDHSQYNKFFHEINDVFHPNESGSFYINHNCFLVNNQTVKTKQIYLLFDYIGDSVSSIIPFSLEDLINKTEVKSFCV